MVAQGLTAMALGIAPHVLKRIAPQVIKQLMKKGIISVAGQGVKKGVVQQLGNVATKTMHNATVLGIEPTKALMTAKTANRIVKGTQGALVLGQGMTEMGFQEQQQIADLIEKGYTPEEAMAEVKSKPLSTLGRSIFEPAATVAMLNGKMPGAALLAGGIQALGGGIQGLDSGINRGYGLGGTLGEVASGTVLGAIPTAFDYAPYVSGATYKKFLNRSKAKEVT